MLEMTTARTAPWLLLACAFAITGAHAQTAPRKDGIDAGARIYQDYCATCHGDELKNTSNGVTYDLRRLRPDEHPRFVTSVLNGKKDMPPWKGTLEEDQIELIWAYIRASVDRQ